MVVALWRSFVIFLGYFVLILILFGLSTLMALSKLFGGVPLASVIPGWILGLIILGILAVGAFFVARRRFLRFEIVKK